MDSNPICHPSPIKKMKCLFLDYVQLLMIGQVGRWTWTPSATPLQPKKWNACFWIMFNFWWSAGLVNGFKPHPPPISSQKNEILIFELHSTPDDRQGWSMDSNPIHNPSPTKKMKCLFLDYVQLLMIGQAGQWTRTPSATPHQTKKWNACFWIMFNFWWLARLVNGLEPHLQPLQPKKWNAHFWITFNFWWLAGLVNGLKPHLPPLSRHKMKCSFMHYIQLVMIGWVGQWTQTPSATPLQPKKWNANFWITFNFWWSAGLVDGLEPHPPPLSSQNNEMLIFGLCSTSDSWLGWSMDLNPIHHLSPAKEWNAHFWITFNFWWSAGLVDGLEPHLPPLSSQKNKMLVFGLCSTSDDWPGWSMDSNPICHPSPAKKMKCLFLDYVQLLMIGQAGQWTWTPSATPLQPKKWYAIFSIMLNFWWLARLVDGLEPHLLPLSSQKNEMLVFGLCSTSDDQPGWSMDSNPIHHPSPAKKMKCSFLYYIQLLMIGQAGHWTRTPSSSCLKPKKMKCSFLDYV